MKKGYFDNFRMVSNLKKRKKKKKRKTSKFVDAESNNWNEKEGN
jgi:hypothetical protein